MPFSRLSSLRKLGSLSGDVVDLAVLEKARQVVALSTDPVSLGIYELTGSASKTVGVSLGEAHQIALIDKMVALVRSGDDLWALLDIKHKPKMDQVGRDCRHLTSCSAGGSAFALGWDGQGTELSLQTNDVEPRAFALRGDVRACDVGRDKTFVIVNGDNGGKFRIHPGLTPESGAMGRADLPSDVSQYDSLAGGEELSVLYKRGQSTVCVIRRVGAGAYEPKLVSLEGGVTAIAVRDTSMFAATEQGAVNLYNGDTLHRASMVPTDATYSLDVSASGKATCLATSTTGGNRLFVGTSNGDVLRCEIAKGEMQI